MQVFPTVGAFVLLTSLGIAGSDIYTARVAHAGGWPASAALIFALSLVGLVALAVERRRYRRVSRALKHERDVTRRLCDGSTSAVILVNTDCRVSEINPAFERFTGVSRRAVRHLEFGALPGFGDAENAECLKLVLQGIECASNWQPRELGGVRRRACYSPMRDVSGSVCGAIVLLTLDDVQPEGRPWLEARQPATA